jgi:hypothetical protein
MSPRDVLAALIHRTPTNTEPDPIEQWPADLRAMPDAAELTTPAVNSINTGEAS